MCSEDDDKELSSMANIITAQVLAKDARYSESSLGRFHQGIQTNIHKLFNHFCSNAVVHISSNTTRLFNSPAILEKQGNHQGVCGV